MVDAKLTPPRVPLVDSNTGLISRAWYMFLLSLQKDVANIDDTTNLLQLQPTIPSDYEAFAIWYTSEGAGAVTRTLQAKLRETTSVKDFGAIGDGVADDTAAIQLCVDSLAALPYGGIAYIPAGNYKITANITIKWPRLVVLQGAGSKLVNILDYRTIVTTNGAITYDASLSAGGDDAYLSTWTGGFSLTKSVNQTVVTGLVITTLGTGKGLYLNGVVGGVYKDLSVHGYETDIYVVDCLGFVMRDVYASQCNYGIYLAGYTTLSPPNACIVENVIASACGTWGLYINGGTVQVQGGTYSDCGTMGMLSGGIYVTTDTSIGLPKGTTIQATWFERNRGSADIYVEQVVSNTVASSVSISNSLFSRLDGVYYTAHNIQVQADGNAILQVLSLGNGFRGYNTYTPNAGRTYIGVTGTHATQVHVSCLSDTYTDALETSFSSIYFGTVGGRLVDITGVPYLYTPGAAVGIGNASGGVVIDNIAWRPAIANTFALGTPTYPFAAATITGNFTWGGSPIMPPPGGTTAFLRSDGQWATIGGTTIYAIPIALSIDAEIPVLMVGAATVHTTPLGISITLSTDAEIPTVVSSPVTVYTAPVTSSTTLTIDLAIPTVAAGATSP